MTKNISKILVIGSGPIIIGQAAEFDYAGTQACASLKEEGIYTILVNSNPATIMTDQNIADAVYIEPLTVNVLSRIIEAEKPEGLLATLGGQTGLNLAVELSHSGILEKFNVDLLGTPLESIETAEDREKFNNLLSSINEPTIPSLTANSIEEAMSHLDKMQLPLVIRPAYTLGGTGGGIANTFDEYKQIVSSGISSSPINQVLIEQSLEGWKEIEYEVMRDASDNCITICNMENIDAMGVHTGDSIVVAPSQTLTDKDYQMLRTASLKIIRALGIEGGCNIQFAITPSNISYTKENTSTSPYYVIEVNPRVSRSSALASKATGYPIARVASKIAIGKTLPEIYNAITKKTVASFEPALDYCVVKIPRWPFDKFPLGDKTLGTQMKATGEVMAIGRSFESAFQKAIRSLEISGRSYLWEKDHLKTQQLDTQLSPNDDRLWALFSALRKGITPNDLAKKTMIDPWFTRSFSKMVEMEKKLSQFKGWKITNLSKEILLDAKKLGFSDNTIATLTNFSSDEIRKKRKGFGIIPVYKMVDTCAAEFEAQTPYFYSTFEDENEASPLKGKKSIVIGSGPIRIGQGIEFDYCSVHAAWALQKSNYKSVIVNSNPETVSTDFDTSDRLYFEPLDEESILDIIENETFNKNSDKNTTLPTTVCQFGGQTAINISQKLDKHKLPILGTSAEIINVCSDRDLFEKFLKKINVPNPPGAAVTTTKKAIEIANQIGYPVLVRPSYVLGGRAMEIVENEKELQKFADIAIDAGEGHTVLIDKYFEGTEIEVDAVCDGDTVMIPGIMEHIERAGVHSGDSIAVYPEISLSKNEIETIIEYTKIIGKSLGLKGLINIQFVVINENNPKTKENRNIYVLEVNPRSSRTIPFISKVTGIPMVQLAIDSMLGITLKSQGYSDGLAKNRIKHLTGVKAPVFSMSKLIGVETHLGPEMKSTGEVMGIDYNFENAITKSLISSDMTLPEKGKILISVADHHKNEIVDMIEELNSHKYSFYATKGTAKLIKNIGIDVKTVNRIGTGYPDILDLILDNTITAVINTVTGEKKILEDSFKIRRAAAEKRIPCFTSIDTAIIATKNITFQKNPYKVLPLHKYFEAPI
ncbi:MAG: carbamoyl-phosphate synthase large subunit [SAR202 cluster bacterium]|nr:carbamoyl-phosphate synthase large subunit [SAR202 cluster bacterium]|tara:strand:+ start:66093 stop:69398 length:3306 start_codon:yes stop_codon:yes gene_type:complete